MAVWQVRLEGFLFGQAHHNRLHFQGAEGVALLPITVADEITNNWCQFWRPMLPDNQFFWKTIRVRNLDQPAFATFVKDVQIPGTGTGFQQSIPQNAFNIRFLTDFGGRKGRGRMYLGTPNPGHMANGILTNQVIAFVNSICANAMGRYGPNGTAAIHLGLWSGRQGEDFKVCTNMFCDSVVRCQRRREFGVGI